MSTIGHSVSELPQMLDLLKALLDAKGLDHSEVARRMGISRRTLTRYLAGQGLTANMLDSLCEIADTSFSKLAMLAARETDNRPGRLSIMQEDALSRHPFAAFLFFLSLFEHALGASQRRFRLLQRQPIARGIDREQRIADLDALVVLHPQVGDGAGDIRRHHHDIDANAAVARPWAFLIGAPQVPAGHACCRHHDDGDKNTNP